MEQITDLLMDSLGRMPVGQLHARAAFWLHHLNNPAPLEDWIADTAGVAQAALLCVHATLTRDPDPLDDAVGLAEAEWLSPEIAWGAIGAARLALGDRSGAAAALTHPDCPPSPLTLPALSRLLQARLEADEAPEAACAHLGVGHDRTEAVLGVLARAPALSARALALLDPPHRSEALVAHLLTGALPDDLPPVSPAAEALWLARGGEEAAARARLAPLLIDRLPTWRASAPSQHAPAFHHLALVCAALSDAEGAVWCLERLADHRPRLLGAVRAATFGPDPRLLTWVLEQGETLEERAEARRCAGLIAARLDRPEVARRHLTRAATLASELEAFYLRRLALQSVSHAQLIVNAPEDALATLDHLRSPRFGHEQRTSAAIRYLLLRQIDRATTILSDIPVGHRRAESCCAASAAMFPGIPGPGV